MQLLFCTAQINEFAKEDLEAACRDYRAFLAALAPGQFVEEAQIAQRKVWELCQEPAALLGEGPAE